MYLSKYESHFFLHNISLQNCIGRPGERMQTIVTADFLYSLMLKQQENERVHRGFWYDKLYPPGLFSHFQILLFESTGFNFKDSKIEF